MHFVQTRAFDYHAASFNDPRFTVVRTPHELAEMVRTIKAQKWIATDTETSGTEWYKHARQCGVAFGYWTGSHTRNYYVPFRHRTGEQQLDESVVLQAEHDILTDASIGKVMHNAKFDRHMFRADGIDVAGPIRDTMIEAHFENENVPLALKNRAATDLHDPQAFVYESIIDAEVKKLAKESKMGVKAYKNAFGYSQLPVMTSGIYAGYDVDFTLRLAQHYDAIGVTSEFAGPLAIERDLQTAIIEMEANGLPVDIEYLQHLRDVTTQAVETIAPQIHQLAGYVFKIGSDEELRHVLQNRFGIRLRKRTKAGKLSVDKEVLEENMDAHPAMPLILEWRQADKIRSTYTQSILDRIGHDGLLHGDLKQVGTNTGRLSSEKPNLQNFAGDSDDRAVKYSGKKLKDGGIDPWSVKRAFCNRGPGWCRGFYDYSQIELRILAYYSQDPTMLDVYARDEDIHARTAREVFGDEDNRRPAKVINFGLSYCLSAGGLARQAKMPMAEAEHFMNVFFQRYPRIGPFRHEFWSSVRANGCEFRNIFGYPRRIPALNSQDGYLRGRSERQAIGSLIQGTAAILTKLSIIRLHQWNKQYGLGLKPCSTVHDEIQIDMPVQNFIGLSKGIKVIMEDFPQIQPLLAKTDVELSTTNWAEKKSYELPA